MYVDTPCKSMVMPAKLFFRRLRLQVAKEFSVFIRSTTPLFGNIFAVGFIGPSLLSVIFYDKKHPKKSLKNNFARKIRQTLKDFA